MLGKPTASLSSGLLARKGHARPAMRPQGFVSLTPSAHEDLGWNDMGDELHPQPHIAVVQPVPVEAPVAVPAPPVLQQRAELAEQIAPKAEAVPAPEPAPVPEPEPKPVVTTGTLALVARDVKTKQAKAAFTLRLDSDRHLRLRLASAVTNHSAQQLVTQALDAFLESLTDVDALARQIDVRERNG
jgi:hypothetical protein